MFRSLVLHDIARHCADHGAFLSAEDCAADCADNGADCADQDW